MNKDKFTIYFDLDDTLADFNTRVRHLCGRDYGKPYKEIWEVLEDEEDFFYNLDPIPEGIDLLYALAMDGYTIKILSALPKLTGNLIYASTDKKDWVFDFVGRYETILVSNWSDKAKYASQYSILIDDSARNIKRFTEHGGYGIQFTPNRAKNIIKLIEDIVNAG